MDPGSDDELSLKRLGRLLLVAVVGAVLSLLFIFVAIWGAFALPMRGAGYITGPLAAALSISAVALLLRATERARSREAPLPLPYDAGAPEFFPAVLTEVRKASVAKKPAGGLLVLSLIAFVAAGASFGAFKTLVLLVPVLFVHELGHLAAMKAFGYRDLNVFFIPFFGAAATGRKEGVPAWQQAVVSLMGPAPGLLGALAFSLLVGPLHSDWAKQALGLTVIINAVNLLPFEPFDGGRVVSVLVFANHPRVRVVFGALTAVMLGIFAYRSGAVAIAIAAGLVLVNTETRYRIASCAQRLRQSLATVRPVPPARLADAPDELIQQVFLEWRHASRTQNARLKTPRLMAISMSSAYDTALVPSAGWAARIGLALVYAALLIPAVLVLSRIHWFG